MNGVKNRGLTGLLLNVMIFNFVVAIVTVSVDGGRILSGLFVLKSVPS